MWSRVLRTQPRVRYEIDSDSESDEEATSGVSQHQAPERHSPKSCGFDDCEWYIRRLHYVSVGATSIPVIWAEGDPEDDIIKTIHETELRMKGLNTHPYPSVDDRAWLELDDSRCCALKQLYSALETRLKKYGKKSNFNEV